MGSGLMGGDCPGSWSLTVLEHLSDTYVRSQVTVLLLLPLVLSDFLSLAMVGEGHGGPAQS